MAINRIEPMQGTGIKPIAPASFAAAQDIGGEAIDLSWVDAAADYDVLQIESSLDEVTWTFVINMAKDVEAYKHSGLTAATEYFYRAKARKRFRWTAFVTDNATTAV